jgi:1,4-dihydroxy-2-naphthoyl-CoA hydrolase
MNSPNDVTDLLASMPFAAAVGVELVAAHPDEVIATLAWDEQRCTAGGVMHGGALLTLADSAGAVCGYLNLSPGAATSTIDSSAAFLRGVRSGTARAVSRPLHTGRSVIVVRTEITTDDGRLAVHVVQSQAVLQPRGADHPRKGS